MTRDDARLAEVAARFGTPLYVYDVREIAARAEALRRATAGRFELSWAMKSNPNPALVARMRAVADTLDVSSIGEVERAVEAGWDAAQMTFVGPAKGADEIRRAVEVGVGHLVVESREEATEAGACAVALGRAQPVLLRISPSKLPKGFGSAMAGRATAFGFDEEELDDAIEFVSGRAGLDVQGFHAFAGTQCLEAESIVANLTHVARMFREACARHDRTPTRLVFGSGFGIPYHDGDAELDVDAVAEGLRETMEGLEADERTGAAVRALELGRWLVGPAGTYLTRVRRIKRSRGAVLALVDGGMHHNLAAAGHLGSVFPRNYPIRLVHPARAGDAEEVDLCGVLCTSIDVLGRRARLPPLEQGDLLAIAQSGAYGRSASPLGFISHPPPREVLLDGDADPLDVTPA